MEKTSYNQAKVTKKSPNHESPGPLLHKPAELMSKAQKNTGVNFNQGLKPKTVLEKLVVTIKNGIWVERKAESRLDSEQILPG